VSSPHLDPHTPVLVGVGQSSDPIDSPDYHRSSPVDLATTAARRALSDTGLDAAAVAAAIDTVAGVRQFEISTPGAVAPLGRSDNYPRSVAARLGAQPARAILEVAGGQGPQHLVTELAGGIAAGRDEVALVFGSEAISTARHLARAEDRPDFTETVEGNLEDRGHGLEGLISEYTVRHGLTDAPSQYAFFDNARRARLKQSRIDYLHGMGELFAPFTRVAATNPHAAAPTRRSAEELATPSEANRPIADPYLRYLVARDQVNQGAAVLVMSVAVARRLGVPEEKWVFLHGHADLRERDLLDRADLSAGPASVMAARHALEVAGIGVDDLATIDLYSCFPIAVSNVCDGLGLAPDDPRGLTLTGGLPFFGGAGNNYSMHAIAETVDRARRAPGSYGLVGANGGTLSKYSVGVYSTAPTRWRTDRSGELQAEIGAWPAPRVVESAEGRATIETYTVKHDRSGRRTGVVVGQLEDSDARFLALVTDEAGLDLLGQAEEPIGTTVRVASADGHNVVTIASS
jgi:acetyl-CoA C-acetyltransferase